MAGLKCTCPDKPEPTATEKRMSEKLGVPAADLHAFMDAWENCYHEVEAERLEALTDEVSGRVSECF